MRMSYSIYLALTIPGKWGMSFHSYGRGHKMQYPPCTSAKASANHPFPWAHQTSLLGQSSCLRNSRGDDEQQRLTKVVFVYQLMQGSAQWTYTVLYPLSSHAHYQLYKSETCHNPLNTCILIETVVKKPKNEKTHSTTWKKWSKSSTPLFLIKSNIKAPSREFSSIINNGYIQYNRRLQM